MRKNTWHSFCMARNMGRNMGRKPDKKLDIFVRNIYGLHI